MENQTQNQPHNPQKRTYVGDLPAHVGTEVTVQGWVDGRRDHGKLIFIDIRDMSGKAQMVALPSHTEAHATASMIRQEWVIEVRGKVNPRPEKMVNKNEPNGAVEIEILEMRVLNEAETPGFDVRGDGREINEEVRLAGRYLDLRRPRLQKNFRNRHKVTQFIRNRLTGLGFAEIETPLLSASTPEGSRDYIVPSRLEQGTFYALPQSPQQYKQLLMTAGFEKYFQIARCMRDEDTRGDRQPEFTQLDLEMSFVEREDVMALNEALLIELVKTVYPHKKIQQMPFPRMTYREVMDKYGSDKPDIRNDKNDPDLLAFLWVVDFPFFEKVEEKDRQKMAASNAGTEWTFSHNPFSAPKPEHMQWLLNKEKIGDILTTQYDIVLNGFEIGGGSIRNHRSQALAKVFEIMGYDAARIERNFGHMIKALSSGTPPHGGIAWGFDRLMMILENEPNIREVIAFAKTGEGRDLMMGAPSAVGADRLKELGISLDQKKA